MNISMGNEPSGSSVGTSELVVRGAKQHNLKNIDVTIPRNKLVVITGVSGSGKSSLAFDIIYAEARGRYLESLSPFIRHRMEKFDRPKVDFIGGLSPALAIDQKVISKNPRSTVGTVTEVAQYLRLLYSRIGTPHCLNCGRALRPQSAREIANLLFSTLSSGARLRLLAPVVWNRKGAHSAVLEQARQDGYTYARIDGSLMDLRKPIKLAAAKIHTIELVVENLFQIPAPKGDRPRELTARMIASVGKALSVGNAVLIVSVGDGREEMRFCSQFVCPYCGVRFPELTSEHFSYNSPLGMCPDCRGLGVKLEVDPDLLINDPQLSILDGALTWYGNLRKNKKSSWPLGPLDVIAGHYNADLNAPWRDLPQRFRDVILYGSGNEKIRFRSLNGAKETLRSIKGLVPEISRLFRESISDVYQKKYSAYMRERPCPSCGGFRLNNEACAVTLNEKTIAEISSMPIDEVIGWAEGLRHSLDDERLKIADEILKEVHNRLSFMIDVDLHYLTLDRPVPSLSAGEGQRVRLASQLGSGLVGVLYILDEPSIGLHARDHRVLLNSLIHLRDMGNTVLIIEHDAETMRMADWLIDLGPGAGILGGRVVAVGSPGTIAADPRSLTGRYLNGGLNVVSPNEGIRRKPSGGWLTVSGASLNNLKNVTLRVPLGVLTCVTGVSGSGKSSLIIETLEAALARALQGAQSVPGPYDNLTGLENVDKVINITQAPIGRTPRSNPATYTGVFDEIRNVFAKTSEAKARRYSPSTFSFNAKGGRCEACKGLGQVKIEMHFLADVFVTCRECNGARFAPETLTVLYKGKSIADVLEMDVQEALTFFADYRQIVRVLQTLCDVGLGYIKLGQSATTLSGGETQRIKLASELSRPATGRTVYILDEPTTGLHFADIQALLNVLHDLVEAGNSVIVIEHNLDLIKAADWIIDLGPEGGEAGGEIIAQGPPEVVAQVEKGYTGQFLREILAGSVVHASP